jgi:hypothetical protein
MFRCQLEPPNWEFVNLVRLCPYGLSLIEKSWENLSVPGAIYELTEAFKNFISQSLRIERLLFVRGWIEKEP